MKVRIGIRVRVRLQVDFAKVVLVVGCTTVGSSGQETEAGDNASKTRQQQSPDLASLPTSDRRRRDGYPMKE